MTDYEDLQRKCQRGATNLNDANNLLAECYGMLGKLGVERDKIDSDRKACRAEFKVQGRMLDEIKAENEALKRDKSEPCDGCFMAEAEALRKDAGRYRFLRNGPDGIDLTGADSMEDIDALIDSAMSKEA